MDKPFELGLIVGRFQTLHLGHEDMIGKACAVCRRVGVLVGSSQESGTEKNPFSYELRREMLLRVFGERVEVRPLPDIGVGNNSRWGDYVLDTAQAQFGALPDLFVTGQESRRTQWYDSPRGENMAQLIIPKTIAISGTEMRGFFLRDERAVWTRYTSQALHPMYDRLRRAVLDACGNPDTKSM